MILTIHTCKLENSNTRGRKQLEGTGIIAFRSAQSRAKNANLLRTDLTTGRKVGREHPTAEGSVLGSALQSFNQESSSVSPLNEKCNQGVYDKCQRNEVILILSWYHLERRNYCTRARAIKMRSAQSIPYRSVGAVPHLISNRFSVGSL